MKRTWLIAGALSAALMMPVVPATAGPAPSDNIVETAQKWPVATTFLKMVNAAGLSPLLQGKGPFIVFTPDNDAFSRLPSGTVEILLKPENKALLVSVVKYHILPRTERAENFLLSHSGTNITTLNGEKLIVRQGIQGKGTVLDTPLAQRAGFNSYNLVTTNGVMHDIDTVLLPPSVVRALSKIAPREE